jgi:hypothetical protein
MMIIKKFKNNKIDKMEIYRNGIKMNFNLNKFCNKKNNKVKILKISY